MRAWRRLNDLAWPWRWPLKLAILLVVVAVVLYPKFWLLPRCIKRLGNMNAVLDPHHPALGELEQRVRQALAPPPATLPAAEPGNSTVSGSRPAALLAGEGQDPALAAVQQVVYERVPYAWDWDTWGVFEYIPTVAEVFERGREDCDGRAVVAASLLRRMGCDAWLVSDLLHVWVQTPAGETMSPTGGEKTLVATEAGTQTTISPGLVRNLARGLAYGVAVFPLGRELIILAAICVLAMQPRSAVWRRVAGCLLLGAAFGLLRASGQEAALGTSARDILLARGAVGVALGGWLVLVIRAGRRPPRSAATPPE